MVLNKYSDVQMKKMSMINIASLVLADTKEEMNFTTLFDRVATLKGLAESEKEDLLARFYTDLNIDGRFTTLGANVWALKRWYPVDQTTEKSLAESRKRDLEEEEFEEEEDEEVVKELGEEKPFEAFDSVEDDDFEEN